MEFQTRVDGKKIYPADIKIKIVQELNAGVSAAELGRKYQIPVQNILKWNRKQKASENATYHQAQPEEMVPVSDYRKAITELEEELKRVKRSLANMTVDRDILKDAVDIAAKKKWI
jgi:transposase-like protein